MGTDGRLSPAPRGNSAGPSATPNARPLVMMGPCAHTPANPTIKMNVYAHCLPRAQQAAVAVLAGMGAERAR